MAQRLLVEPANPSLLALCRDLAAAVKGASLPAELLYAVVALAALAVTAWSCRRRTADDAPARVELVLLATLAYAVVMPRFEDYSFLLLVPAATRIVAADPPARAALWLLVAFGGPDSFYRHALGGFAFGALIAPYQRWFIAALLWGMTVTAVRARRPR